MVKAILTIQDKRYAHLKTRFSLAAEFNYPLLGKHQHHMLSLLKKKENLKKEQVLPLLVLILTDLKKPNFLGINIESV